VKPFTSPAWRVLAAFTVALVLAACGRKAPPKPPEFAAPRAIGDLRAINRADGIVLSWSRPRQHPDGTPLNSLGSFAVERAAVSGASGFQQVATLEVSDRERFRQTRTFRYLDQQPQPGEEYLYRVIAYTDDGYGSEPSNIVTITREIPPTPTATPPSHGRGNTTPTPR
jgi:hypothetical protein